MLWVVENLCGGPTHDDHFLTAGSCVHPFWITCIEIKKGHIAPVRWRIKVCKKGNLYVQRKVIGGPLEIAAITAAS